MDKYIIRDIPSIEKNKDINITKEEKKLREAVEKYKNKFLNKWKLDDYFKFVFFSKSIFKKKEIGVCCISIICSVLFSTLRTTCSNICVSFKSLLQNLCYICSNIKSLFIGSKRNINIDSNTLKENIYKNQLEELKKNNPSINFDIFKPKIIKKFMKLEEDFKNKWKNTKKEIYNKSENNSQKLLYEEEKKEFKKILDNSKYKILKEKYPIIEELMSGQKILFEEKSKLQKKKYDDIKEHKIDIKFCSIPWRNEKMSKFEKEDALMKNIRKLEDEDEKDPKDPKVPNIIFSIFSFNINKNKKIEEKFEEQIGQNEFTLKLLSIYKSEYELLNKEDIPLKNSLEQDNNISEKYYHYYNVSGDKKGWRLRLFFFESLEDIQTFCKIPILLLFSVWLKLNNIFEKELKVKEEDLPLYNIYKKDILKIIENNTFLQFKDILISFGYEEYQNYTEKYKNINNKCERYLFLSMVGVLYAIYKLLAIIIIILYISLTFLIILLDLLLIMHSTFIILIWKILEFSFHILIYNKYNEDKYFNLYNILIYPSIKIILQFFTEFLIILYQIIKSLIFAINYKYKYSLYKILRFLRKCPLVDDLIALNILGFKYIKDKYNGVYYDINNIDLMILANVELEKIVMEVYKNEMFHILDRPKEFYKKLVNIFDEFDVKILKTHKEIENSIKFNKNLFIMQYNDVQYYPFFPKNIKVKLTKNRLKKVKELIEKLLKQYFENLKNESIKVDLFDIKEIKIFQNEKIDYSKMLKDILLNIFGEQILEPLEENDYDKISYLEPIFDIELNEISKSILKNEDSEFIFPKISYFSEIFKPDNLLNLNNNYFDQKNFVKTKTIFHFVFLVIIGGLSIIIC